MVVLSNRSEGVCAPVTGYAIPARVGVWGVWGGQLSGVGFAARVCRAAVARRGGRCFSGSEFGDGDHPDAFS